jgi:predicted secreted protein
MKTRIERRLLLVILGIVLLAAGCASTATSSENPQLAGTWRLTGSKGILVMELKDFTDGWNGNVTGYDHSGNVTLNETVTANTNGRITLGTDRARFQKEDVMVKGKYLGEKLTVKGSGFVFHFYKTMPAGNITLSGTTWKLNNDYSLVFKADGTFNLEMSGLVRSVLSLSSGGAVLDTEGTYTVNGTAVTMNYPTGNKVKLTAADNGTIITGTEKTKSHTVFIEGSFLVSDNVGFELVKFVN